MVMAQTSVELKKVDVSSTFIFIEGTGREGEGGEVRY